MGLTQAGRELRSFTGHKSYVRSVAFSPDGRFALSGGGSGDNTLKLWDIASGRELPSFRGHTHSVSSVAVLPDDRFALSGSGDKTLKLWDISKSTQRP
jgi:WD40 repeat protein